MLGWILCVFSLVYSTCHGSEHTGSELVEHEGLCHLSQCLYQDVLNTSVLYHACQGKENQLNGRCCYHSEKITGIDLSHCVITEVSLLVDSGHFTRGYNMTTVEIVILADNPLTSCGEDTFSRMKSLTYLSLPSMCPCPGGDEAWNRTKHNSLNETICEGLLTMCSLVQCPANSHCELHSPSEPWCLCNDGYYGYKCLRTGSFQTITFSCSIAGATAVISATLWAISRRKARKID